MHTLLYFNTLHWFRGAYSDSTPVPTREQGALPVVLGSLTRPAIAMPVGLNTQLVPRFSDRARCSSAKGAVKGAVKGANHFLGLRSF
jgi:hypothetical protein